MDEIAGSIDEEVIMQIGRTNYIPQNTKYLDFTTEGKLKELCQQARVVVTHGGMIIVDALEKGTPVIAVPRLKRYGEAINDHQLYLVQELEKVGKVIGVYDVEELEEALKKAGTKPVRFEKDRRLVNILKEYITQFERE